MDEYGRNYDGYIEDQQLAADAAFFEKEAVIDAKEHIPKCKSCTHCTYFITASEDMQFIYEHPELKDTFIYETFYCGFHSPKPE